LFYVSHSQSFIVLIPFMDVFRYRNNALLDFHFQPTLFHKTASAISIGTYDGLHLGHRAILSTLVADARRRGLRSMVITFEPHPRMVLGKTGGAPIHLLTTLGEKLPMFESLGIDAVIVIDFTKTFSETSAETFITEFLISQIGLGEIVIGYDHMFGKDRNGSLTTIMPLAEKYGFSVKVIEEQKVLDKHLSSTAIRRALETGNIEDANALLGSAYRLTGRVSEGDKRGRTIGFPTANLVVPPEKLLPKNGVYVCDTDVNGKTYRGMLNIGFRPTVKKEPILSVEAHLINFDGNLYGETLSLRLLNRLRDEKKFGNLDELTRQLNQDKALAAGFREKILHTTL
jgi:riboflavin kinase / FMN adenylyltransferase